MDLLNFLLKNSYLEINEKKFRIRKGVPQGSTISPLLFDIFMDDLVSFLKDKPSNERIEPIKELLCYADDVAILFKGIMKLDTIIKNLEDWSLKNGMTINKKKSGIMFIKLKDNKNFQNKNTDQKIKGFPIVDKYKFLGITIAPNFELKYHFEDIKRKTNYISSKVLALPRKVISPFQVSILWTLLVRSILFYGILILPYLTTRKND